MHVFQANSFVTCFEHLDKKDAFLFKSYPQANDKSEEERLKAASIQLANDVLSMTFGIMNKIVLRNQNEKINELLRELGKLTSIAVQNLHCRESSDTQL